MAKIQTLAASLPGVSAEVLALRSEFTQGAMRTVASLPLPGREVEILEGRDALWAVLRRSGKGGLAVRPPISRVGRPASSVGAAMWEARSAST